MFTRKISLSPSLALFTSAFLIFFFTLLNGYLLNLIGDYKADARLVVAGLIVEMLGAILYARRFLRIERDPLELAGFLLVTIFVWWYFVFASLPTLMPPTLSSDAVRVYLQTVFSFPEGKLVSWYPAGGAFVAAMFSRWMGWEPLRVLHLVAASFLALSAGAAYGMTRAALAGKRFSQIFALAAPALLFVPWSYFAGIIISEQYFFAQAFAQYFILAALWFAARYAQDTRALFAILFGAALLGIVAAYPYFVPLALAVFVVTVMLSYRLSRFERGTGVRIGIVLAIFLALIALAALAIERGGILEIAAAGRIATVAGVGDGGVTNPSLDNLGGLFFILPAFAGIPFAWRAGARGRALIAFLIAWVLQLIALTLAQPLLKISDYRLDKTFYILVYPLAMLGALALAALVQPALRRVYLSPRGRVAAFVAVALALGAAVWIARPPKVFAPFTETELQLARWAKENLNTYEIAYLDPVPVRAYWLAFGIWRETLPNEWFQWIPAGVKMGPATFEEWLANPAWHPYVLVRDLPATRADARLVKQIGDRAILERAPAPRDEPRPTFLSPWYFGATMRLVGYDLASPLINANSPFTFRAYTEAIYPPPATVDWRVEIVARDGKIIGASARAPFDNFYPLQRVPPGATARDLWTIPLAANAAPGAYEVRLGLYRRENGEPIAVWHASETDLVHRRLLNAAPIAQIKLPLAPPSAAEWRQAKILDARVGENFALARYALAYDRAAQRARITLYWRGIAKSKSAFTVFVHLLDASGNILAQKDAEPLNGAYPTFIWDAGEIVREEYEFKLPADAAPKTIVIGMYAQPSLARLPVFDASGAPVGDRIELPME